MFSLCVRGAERAWIGVTVGKLLTLSWPRGPVLHEKVGACAVRKLQTRRVSNEVRRSSRAFSLAMS